MDVLPATSRVRNIKSIEMFEKTNLRLLPNVSSDRESKLIQLREQFQRDMVSMTLLTDPKQIVTYGYRQGWRLNPKNLPIS